MTSRGTCEHGYPNLRPWGGSSGATTSAPGPQVTASQQDELGSASLSQCVIRVFALRHSWTMDRDIVTTLQEVLPTSTLSEYHRPQSDLHGPPHCS